MSVIEVLGLKKSFGGLEVLRGIDLTVEAGASVTLDPISAAQFKFSALR